jgi:tRNA U34 5-methylaminomethyl-2-thiouridine-forming methyltransferase MnmC
MSAWPTDLTIFTTGDGSPTLSFAREDGYIEKMHHSAGALSESLYIYHAAAADALARGWPLHVLSFGLGLGYNELLAIAEAKRQSRLDWKVDSFEAHPFLRREFARWLRREHGPLSEVLDRVLEGVAEKLELSASTILDEAGAGLSDGRLTLRGPFPQDRADTAGCTVVFYDAFSNKMETDPWLETTLQNELGPCLAKRCIFTTYAATGSLNRGLKSLGFRLLDRKGFEGKRESTLAIRE